MREGNSAEESTKRNYRRKGEGRKMWGLNVKWGAGVQKSSDTFVVM